MTTAAVRSNDDNDDDDDDDDYEAITITTGLEIISGESPDTMTGQIHFSAVTYHFWPVKDK